MDDCVINLLLGQVKPAAYTYPEIRILQLSVPFAVLAESARDSVSIVDAERKSARTGKTVRLAASWMRA